jgi:hypothetical protein
MRKADLALDYFKEGFNFQTRCPEFVRDAAEIVEQMP